MFISKNREIVASDLNSCMPEADRFVPANDTFPASSLRARLPQATSLRAVSMMPHLKRYITAAKQSLEKSGFNTMI
jgi:hypothetical protein